MFNFARLLAFVTLAGYAFSQEPADPCAELVGLTWVAPKDLRACYQSFKLKDDIKNNVIEVITKSLAFHTSVNYQLQSPPPYEDLHEDILADLARIKAQSYDSEYDFHLDLSSSVKRLNDGHCVWANTCFDSAYFNFLPIPLVLLTDTDGTQSVHIDPFAYSVASASFPDQIHVWEDALPGDLNGNLKALNGAKVVTIDGKDPWVAVDANAAIIGGYQSKATRQNSFFSSYQQNTFGFNYVMGNFAQQSLPRSDFVELDLILVNQTTPVKVTLPYRARAENASPYCSYPSAGFSAQSEPALTIAKKFRQAPTPDEKEALMNVIMDTTSLSDVAFPSELDPPAQTQPGNFGWQRFFDLDDGKTGVLSLGSFSSANLGPLQDSIVRGLTEMKKRGKTQLIVDVTNNGGGLICLAHWLHRVLAGPKASTVPQAGLDTKARNNPLARAIVDDIIANNRSRNLLYAPGRWKNASHVSFSDKTNWLLPPVNVTVNGREDQFSQRLGDECQPWGLDGPAEALFDASKIAIVSNGRCASSCSLFSITMKKLEGAKTVVVGGKKDVQQHYCGTVGGQSTDYGTIDSQIKASGLKSDPAAPPDLLVFGTQGITWRLAYSPDHPEEPEEWQDHSADYNLPLTAELANNPFAIWTEVAKTVFN